MNVYWFLYSIDCLCTKNKRNESIKERITILRVSFFFRSSWRLWFYDCMMYSSYIFCGCWVICSILCLFVKLCPYWMMEWDVIHLYGLGQSSPHELVFTAELNPISLFFTFFPWAILDQLTSYGWSRLW